MTVKTFLILLNYLVTRGMYRVRLIQLRVRRVIIASAHLTITGDCAQVELHHT